MRLLVITSDSRWVNAVREAFPGAHDVISGDGRQVAALLPVLRVVDACFVAESVLGMFTVDALKQLSIAGDVPLFALADDVRPEWEEPVMIAGARQVFKSPIRAGILQLAVSRASRPLPVTSREMPLASPSLPSPASSPNTLGLLREFSELLLVGSTSSFASAFQTALRDSLGCARLLLWTRRTVADAAFELECTTGVDGAQFEGFRLHLGHGLGRIVHQRGCVVARQRLRPEFPEEATAARELAVFGAELAVPVVGTEGLSGVLLVGPRIAGGDYTEGDITQLYHVMEGYARASTRVQPVGPKPSMAAPFPAILHRLPVGCALLDDGMRVLEANDAFRTQLGSGSTNPLGMEMLPPAWAGAIRELKNRGDVEAQRELDHDLSGAVRRIRVSIRRIDGSSGRWLIVTEDITSETRLRQELQERASQNVLQRAGEQLSNDFRNALTPIEILVQLSGDANGKRDLDRLRVPVSMAIHRLRRRVDNLGYLTKTSIFPEQTTVAAVFRSARDRLDNWLEAKQLKTLIWSGEFSKVTFTADTAALGMAIAELVVNAVEAAAGRPVTITADDLPEAVHFKIRNPGEWSPPSDATGFGHRPFVTTKSGGVGLGVEVVSRVAEHHGGRLVLGPVASDIIEAVLRIPRQPGRVGNGAGSPDVSAASV